MPDPKGYPVLGADYIEVLESRDLHPRPQYETQVQVRGG